MLFCEYYPKQNEIQKHITDFSKKQGYYIHGQNEARLVTDNNQYYFLYDCKKYPIHVKYDYDINAKFVNCAHFILNSEFTNGIQSRYIENNCLGVNAALTIDHTLFRLYIREKYGKLPVFVILYDSREDVLEFQSVEEKIDKESLGEALNIAFPSETLNDYHVKTILSSEEREKTVVLEEFGLCNAAKFDIQPNENQYVLRRVRK